MFIHIANECQIGLHYHFISKTLEAFIALRPNKNMFKWEGDKLFSKCFYIIFFHCTVFQILKEKKTTGQTKLF
jgi:hypothetical protein